MSNINCSLNLSGYIYSNLLDENISSLFNTLYTFINEPRCEKTPAFCICKNKGADQLHCERAADQRLCFRYIDSKIPLQYQVSNHLLWMYSPVFV